MMIAGFNGSDAEIYKSILRRGALTSLLLQSPWGELPTGGRSSQHQWNEAMQCFTFEYFAGQYRQLGQTALSGAFKRAAALSFQSLQRWRRAEGDFYVVKNRFLPKERFGFESYSYQSNYNLLTAAFLADAYMHASDDIAQSASFAEVRVDKCDCL